MPKDAVIMIRCTPAFKRRMEAVVPLASIATDGEIDTLSQLTREGLEMAAKHFADRVNRPAPNATTPQHEEDTMGGT